MHVDPVSALRTEIAHASDFDAVPNAPSVVELISYQAAATPLSSAIVCGDRAISYHELEATAVRIARQLIHRGVAPNTRIAVVLDRSIELVIALLAIWKAGSAYVPLDPTYPKDRLSFVIKNVRPAAILTKTSLPQSDVLERCIESADAECCVINLDSEESSERSQFVHARDEAAYTLDDFARSDDLAYVIYTSGSTGVPKGVRLAHRSVSNLFQSMKRKPGISSTDVWLAVTTISFDIALLELFLPLTVGAKVVLARESETADPSQLCALMKRHGVTMLQATPMTWRRLVDIGWRDPQLKMWCGGEALSRKLAAQLLERGGELWNLYGPTETCVWSSVLKVESGEGPVLLGPPIDRTTFHVLDSERRPVTGEEQGELFIGGEGVALGYVELPDLTAQRFVFNPFDSEIFEPNAQRMYRTGDIVRRKSNGCLEFIGRADHQIKVRGYRVELGEIETTLLKHPLVALCAAAVDLPTESEAALFAYVVLQTDRTPYDSGAEVAVLDLNSTLRIELQSLLNQHLPSYMHPSAIVRLSHLPLTENGKVDRRALPKPIPDTVVTRAGETSQLDVEQRLAAIWKSLLNLGELDESSNFFLLGGHSLLAAQLLERLEQEFNVQLTIAALFGAPTLGQQIQLLQRWDDRPFDFRKLVQLNAEGTQTPLVVVHNTGIYSYHLAQLLGPLQPVTALQLFDPASPEALPTSIESIASNYVQLLKRVQPRGPYRLLGWCIGGVLAFEIACQLTELNQTVEFVGMIDTWAPNHHRRQPKLKAWLSDRSYRAQLIWSDWRKVLSGGQTMAAFLRNRVFVKKILGIRDAHRPLRDMFSERHLSGEHYDQWLVGYLDEVAARYTPRPYPGRISLLSSSREPSGLFLDAAKGWHTFARGGIDRAVLDGDHFTVFRGAGLQQLATLITLSLAKN